MHATHLLFLTTRSLYVLVLNGRNGGEDADAEYWLRLIDSFGAGSPVIVVLNKIKEQPFDINRRALQRRISSRLSFATTDCEDGTGINELRELILREVSTQLPIHTVFPSSWFAIKNRLEAATHNFITFDRYRAICSELGEQDPNSQELLGGFLHCLGTVLNYRDDPRLKDTHVLNPHWVTNGIYRLINSGAVQARMGEITLGESAEVLPVSEYPVGMRRFLFDLMKKFELCFSFPEDDCRYLIPDLLDKQEPETLPTFQPECLRFRYRYDVLPEGLLPRFIVRTHSLSEGLQRWRSGVVLRFEGNTALIRAVAERLIVDIEVGGDPEGQKQLLAIVRADFEKIHHDIARLRPHSVVPIPGAPEAEIPYEDLKIWETEGRANYAIRVGANQSAPVDSGDRHFCRV
jgi:internalin A